MSEKLYKIIEITDLKDMLNKTKDIYSNDIAYKIRVGEKQYKEISHKKVREMIDSLGTALINMGLKNKRIAVIGENRYEWEIAYLSIVCGTGIVVPLDKSLPENELESLIKRSEVEAIFYSKKYENILKNIKYKEDNKLKHLISMDNNENIEGIYSQNELIQNGKKLIELGNREFIDAQIDSEKMSIMLFTSGTTSNSKVVALSHKNICSNLMDIGSILDVNSNDIVLSILPIHHVFECTVGFLFSLYKGAQTVFCDGIRHILENINDYKVTVMACVPGIYERLLKINKAEIGKLNNQIKLFISGAAALDSNVEKEYRNLGINIVQGYGLTETSPVVAVGTNKEHRIGSVGKNVPSVETKLLNINNEGIGELVVKGPSVALGYYQDDKSTKEAFEGEWFHTGDLAKIDEDGYIYICGRKKSVIVLKNGKNIFPEEMESLVNKIEGVNESFIFGKQQSEDKENIKINVKLVIDKEIVKKVYKVNSEKEIENVMLEKIKEINAQMPKYKAIRGTIITEIPLIRTTTNKIKRQANLDAINEFKN